MTKVRKRKKPHWSNKALKAEIEKLDDTVEIYWHYDDAFCTEDVKTIFEKGLEGLDEISMEIQSRCWEEFDRLREEAIVARLDAMRLVDKVSDKCEKRFRDMVEDSDKLLTDCDLKQLARNTGAARCVVIVNEPEISFQAWRGVESKHQVDEICELCTLLNVNPVKLQSFVSGDNENRPSYDPEPAIFPDHPEREGREYVTIESVIATLNETSYGGQLVFMFKLPLVDLIEDPDGYTKGDIRIKKGTLGLIYDYMNGAGSCEDMELLKDLELKAGTFSLELDAARKWGLQACYGFTDAPWKQGSVEPVTPKETPEDTSIKAPYGQTFPLLTAIENVECWNKTGPERFTLPAGTLLKLEHGYDTFHTTCMAQDPDNPGKALELYPLAYRWIVNNLELAEAIGVPMPERTIDIVGEIIAAES